MQQTAEPAVERPRTLDEYVARVEATLIQQGKLADRFTEPQRAAVRELFRPAWENMEAAERLRESAPPTAELLGQLERLEHLYHQLEAQQLEAAEAFLQRPAGVQVTQHNKVTFSVPTQYGSYRSESAHVALDHATGELAVWSPTGRTEGGNPVYEWRKADEANGPRLTALYVHEGRVYDHAGNEVTTLQNGNTSGQISTRWMVDHLTARGELREGRLSTIDSSRMMHIATHQGKVAVFTLGRPPAFRDGRGPNDAVVERTDEATDRSNGQSERAQPEQQTRPAYETITYHTPQHGCYYQRQAHVRLSDGSNGGVEGRLEIWNGRSWEAASASQHPARQMTCLYCVDGKVYDERGRRVHSVSDDGRTTSVTDILHSVRLEEGRVSAVSGRGINNVTYNGKPVVFTQGVPPGFEQGFRRSQVGNDVAVVEAMVPAGRTQRLSMTIDPQSGAVTDANGRAYTGFEVRRDGAGNVTEAVWSSEGRPQMRIVKQGDSWVVQRRAHEQHYDAWGNVRGTYSTWVRDPSTTLTARRPAL